MKNVPVDLNAMSEGERELFLEMEREEQAEIERYLKDPELMERARAYKVAVDEMLEERAAGPTAITFASGLSDTEIDMGFEQFEKMSSELSEGGIHIYPGPSMDLKVAFTQAKTVNKEEVWIVLRLLIPKIFPPEI